MRNRIEMPPTPSSGPSSPPSPQNAPLKAGAAAAHMQKSQSGFALLQHKLKLHQNTPTHHQLHNSHSQLSTRTDSKRSIEEAPPPTTTTKSKCMSTHWMCPTFCGGCRSTDVLDPQGRFYISWLFLVTMSFVYNAYVIPFRASFPFQTPENTPVWLAMDYCCDLIYLLDIVFVKHRLIYLYDGFWVKDKAMTRQNYIRKLQFKVMSVSREQDSEFILGLKGNHWGKDYSAQNLHWTVKVAPPLTNLKITYTDKIDAKWPPLPRSHRKYENIVPIAGQSMDRVACHPQLCHLIILNSIQRSY